MFGTPSIQVVSQGEASADIQPDRGTGGVAGHGLQTFLDALGDCGSKTSGTGDSVWFMTAPWEPPLAGTEETQLIGALERMRTTFRFKADGLDAAGLSQRIGKSSLTLGGLLKHLALCEDNMFTNKLDGSSLGELWADADWDADPDWEFTTAASDSPETLYGLWDGAVERSRQRLAAALAKDGGLGQLTAAGWGGEHASLRRLVTDLIEEYGRHTGHADLLREAVDGVTGEDPPDDWRPVSGHYRMPYVAG
jgi:hypothetical protein